MVAVGRVAFDFDLQFKFLDDWTKLMAYLPLCSSYLFSFSTYQLTKPENLVYHVGADGLQV